MLLLFPLVTYELIEKGCVVEPAVYWVENICVAQYLPSTSIIEIAVCVCEWKMLCRWPGEWSHAQTRAAGVV